jgi:hypothetical protein
MVRRCFIRKKRGFMRRIPRLWVLSGMVLTFAAAGCTADVEDPGEMPDVDVAVDPGRAPTVNVQPAEVTVSTDTQTIVTPDVDIEPAN